MLFDLPSLPPKEQYKLVTSTIVPRPIAWVVTLDQEGRCNAAPFSFFNVLANDPVVVGFSIGPRASGGGKDTVGNIRRTGQFVVCLVGEDTTEAMNVTAVEFPPGVDEIAQAGLGTLPSTRVAPPRIAESAVALECETFQTIPIGAYLLVLGRALALHVRDDCVLDAERHYIDTARLRLIGRMEAPNAYVRTTDRFEMPRISLDAFQARRAWPPAKE
ncbi:flavin reductase family protein [Falsiroseomonas sp.]|uniref:flavin reductase family protein n=1 Tax=Falsiroseomonas sp. TaxID=2870721 RepID=UPI0035629DA6